jgi:transcriptional regulator with XRE-family HTH domain
VATPSSQEFFIGEDVSEVSQQVPQGGAVAGTVLRSARLSAEISAAQLAEAADVPEADLLKWEEGSAALASVPLSVFERLETALKKAGAEPRLVADLVVGAWCDLVIIAIADGEQADGLLADPLVAEDSFNELLTWAVADQPPVRYRPYAGPHRLLPAADLNLTAGIIQALELIRPSGAASGQGS